MLMINPIAPYAGRDYPDLGGMVEAIMQEVEDEARGRGPRYSNDNNKDREHHFQPLLSAGEKYSSDLWRFGDVIPAAKVDEASRFNDPKSKEDSKGLLRRRRIHGLKELKKTY